MLVLLSRAWPKTRDGLSAELYFQIMEDVTDVDLEVATMIIIRSDREFPPTPGIIRTKAKEIQSDRDHHEWLEREKLKREQEPPVRKRIQHGGHSKLDDIPFEGDWKEYIRLCKAQAKVEWEECASWCPGFPRYDYSTLGGPYATGVKKGPE